MRCSRPPRGRDPRSAAAGPPAPLDHGPTSGANHVPEEAVRLDLELECVTPPVPGCVLHDPAKTLWCVWAGVNARKSCSPTSRSADSASASSSSGRGYHQLRRSSNGGLAAPVDAVAIGATAACARGSRARLLRRTRPRRRTEALRSAPRAIRSGGRPSTSTEATFPSACTPVSVRPATASSDQAGKPAASAWRISLDCPAPGLRRQAAKAGAVVLECELEARLRPWEPRPAPRARAPGRHRSGRHVVHELEVGHLGRVAGTRADLDDPRVAARPIVNRGATSAKRMCTTSFERRYASACRRAARSPRRPSVIIFSAIGLTAFAFATVVLIRAVLDQRSGQVRVERLAVRRVAAELLSGAMVAHRGSPTGSRRRAG